MYGMQQVRRDTEARHQARFVHLGRGGCSRARRQSIRTEARVDELMAVVRHPLGRSLSRQDGVARGRGHHRDAQRGFGVRKFRRCVREHVMSKIALAEPPPTRVASEWKEHVIEIFMARGLGCAARRELLQ